MDNEIKGEGNSINYKFRMHDPRIGRFFAVDPLTAEYPHYTPYSFSGNKLIHAIELEGLEEHLLNDGNTAYGPYSSQTVDDYNDDYTEGQRGGVGFDNWLSTYEPITIEQISGGAYGHDFASTVNIGGSPASVPQSTPLPIVFNPRFNVENVDGSNLRIIQTVNASPIAAVGDPLSGRGIQQLTIDGQQRTAFVDGGRNSPGFATDNNPAPFYGPDGTLYDPNYLNLEKTATGGRITVFDVPTAAQALADLQFQSFVVVLNYKNTGKLKVVGQIDWGFNNAGGVITPSIANPSVRRTNYFSPTSGFIINSDYSVPPLLPFSTQVYGGGGL